MVTKDWRARMGRLAMLAVPGMMVLGTSCATDIRHSIVAAGLDFVESSAGDVLSLIFPLQDQLGGQ